MVIESHLGLDLSVEVMFSWTLVFFTYLIKLFMTKGIKGDNNFRNASLNLFSLCVPMSSRYILGFRPHVLMGTENEFVCIFIEDHP